MEAFLAIGGIILLWATIIVVILALAFLPTIVAWRRKHPDLLWIFIVNFALGATTIGWVVCLVWAFMDDWRIEKLLSRGEKAVEKFDKVIEYKE